MLSITKIFNFETAHRISNYNGQCSNIHGHSYELHVTVTGIPDAKSDIIFDFKELKKVVETEIINPFDHALLLKKGTTNIESINEMKIVLLDKEPTAERMLEYMVNKMSNHLPEGIKLNRLKLFETKTSYAEWESDI